MESQIKDLKFRGKYKLIAEKTGCNPTYVSRVLNGTVNIKGRQARLIIETNEKLNIKINEVNNN